jgi:HEAT repeat protein
VEDFMSVPAPAPDRLSPDDALPPVEPPNAGFIVQLFVVPAIIVAIIVLVWILFNWLAQMGNDPASYVEALERNNGARWQSAMNLAEALRDPRNGQLKADARVARKLADVLEAELKGGQTDDNALQLRVYLCHALGEFTVPDVVPVLLKATTAGKDPKEKYVRFAALKALAVHISAAPHLDATTQAEVLPVVLKASHDEEALIRSTAAFALGALADDPQASTRLEQMLGDGYPNVRYNAATTLARHGDAAGVEVLGEMLDPDQTAGIDVEEEKGSREYKQGMIVVNALRAVAKLSETNPTADISGLRSAVSKLQDANSKQPKGIRTAATEVLHVLDRRTTAAAGSR